MMKPVILFCDEPFSGLDPLSTRRIESLLQARNPHDLEASAGLQQDHVSLMARELLPLLLARAPSGGTIHASRSVRSRIIPLMA